MDRKAKRLATLVGCNYLKTRNELHGCINDVRAMRGVLVGRFGFEAENIQLLTDEPESPAHLIPTGSNIRAALARMVDRALPGDVLFFHYSGHGTLIPSHAHGNRNKHDEAIVPVDFNLITDVDFRCLVNRLPEGASFTVFSDSCHSGGLIDKEKEQIGPHDHHPTSDPPPRRPKFIPFQSILDHLSSTSGIQSPPQNEIAPHLLHLFGAEVSPKFKSPSSEDLQPQKLLQQPLAPDNGILLSGCQTDETSADMDPDDDGSGSKAYGAFSNAVQMVLKAHQGPITNRELVTRARELLRATGFTQHPCLYCSDNNADATFLWEPARSSF
ncbi:hypothetical protein ACLOJK_000236 [Asimina triloba]